MMHLGRFGIFPCLAVAVFHSSSFWRATTVVAHESCCKHKLQQQAVVSEYIDDPSASDQIPPDVFNGQPRYLADPNNLRPEDWDSEDDGTWEPKLISNPNYSWKPAQIRNPNYQPPPTFWNKLQGELTMVVPWVTLGVIITGLLNVISLPYERIKHYLTATGGSSFGSALVGLATPLCSCGALPVAASFLAQDGASLRHVVAFLTASQSAGLDSAVITWGLLGPAAVLCRLAGALVLAMSAGFFLPATSAHNNNEKEGGSPSTRSKLDNNNKGRPATTTGEMIKQVFFALLDTSVDVFPAILLGVTLSTTVLHNLPGLLLHDQDKDFSSCLIRLAVLASALPLQICEHTSVSVAAAIQKAGGSPGLAYAFLLSAPATNLPSLLFLMKKAPPQNGDATNSLNRLIIVTKVAMALSGAALILSYLVDVLEVDLLVVKENDEGASMASLPSWYVSASPWIAGFLFVIGVIRSVLPGGKDLQPRSDFCNGCPSEECTSGKKND